MSCNLSARQQASLKAFIDGLLPPLPPPNGQAASDSKTAKFWEHRLSADPDFLQAAYDAIDSKLSSHDRFLTHLVLFALSTAVGTSLLFGIPTLHAFSEWSVPERTVLLQRLEQSSIETRRNVFQGLKRLLCGLAFSYTDLTNNNNYNPFWEAMGYPGAPPDDAKAVRAAMQREAGVQKAILTEPSIDDDIILLECDFVICGSGCAGCVAAQVLAKAGFSVIVLEKGKYRSPENINLNEADAMDQQYEQHGLLQTRNGAIMILAGAGVGGGSAINWSCCLPLPEYVRDDWAREVPGLFGSEDDSEYQDALNHMLDKIGASDKSKVTHNGMNQVLQNGCDDMNYQWSTTGQNLKNTDDAAAGYIGLGDRNGNKNAGVQTFLTEAVADGAKIIENCRVERVLTSATAQQQHRRATGVQCVVGERDLTIRAHKSVILAAGSLQTPCILQRSGFRNRHIGKHLRLHPAMGMFAFMPPEKNVDAIVGAPMTTVCNEFARGPTDNGYGMKIENPVAYPGLLGAAIQWISPRTFKNRILRYRSAVPLVLLQRDSGNGGSVKTARDGVGLTIDYTVTKEDRKSMIHGMKGAAQLLLAAGCEEVSTGHIRDLGFKPASAALPTFNTSNDSDHQKQTNEYLESIEDRGMKDHEIGLFSAHQMGTCRMSSSPQTGVVDSNGESWECDDLFVMDASVFPTASGSNPMVTVLTIAYMLSTRLSLMWKLDDPEGHSFSSAGERAKAAKISGKRGAIRSQSHLSYVSLPAIGNFAIILPLAVALIAAWFLGTGSFDVFHSLRPR